MARRPALLRILAMVTSSARATTNSLYSTRIAWGRRPGEYGKPVRRTERAPASSSVLIALLVANIVLVIVTGAYVWLTRSLSKSSATAASASERAAAAAEATAASSQRAAEAAAASAAAAEQAVSVQQAALAAQRASLPIGFTKGAAGPFISGFGCTLATANESSFFVRSVPALARDPDCVSEDLGGCGGWGEADGPSPVRGRFPRRCGHRPW